MTHLCFSLTKVKGTRSIFCCCVQLYTNTRKSESKTENQPYVFCRSKSFYNCKSVQNTQNRRLCRPRKVMNGNSHEISLMCQFLLCPLTVFCQIRCYVNHFVINPRVSTVPAGNHQGSIGGVNVVTMGSTCLETRTSIEEGGAHSATLDDTGVPSCYPAQILR